MTHCAYFFDHRRSAAQSLFNVLLSFSLALGAVFSVMYSNSSQEQMLKPAFRDDHEATVVDRVCKLGQAAYLLAALVVVVFAEAVLPNEPMPARHRSLTQIALVNVPSVFFSVVQCNMQG